MKIVHYQYSFKIMKSKIERKKERNNVNSYLFKVEKSRGYVKPGRGHACVRESHDYHIQFNK